MGVCRHPSLLDVNPSSLGLAVIVALALPGAVAPTAPIALFIALNCINTLCAWADSNCRHPLWEFDLCALTTR